jgi:drug/metabolite transporter (DMT)-like permease
LKKPGGIILILIGLIIIIWGAFGFKTREKVVDVGPIQATKDTEHHVPYAPIAGAIVLIGGVVLLVSGRR